jgi:hypothetical protein
LTLYRTIGSIILKISYGYSVQDCNDPLVELADKAMAQFSDVITPGAYFVDIIPIRSFLFYGLQHRSDMRHGQ